jgi:alpha-aminoadipate/glutamate carrier protein LysW
MVKCPLCDAPLDFDEDEMDEGDELNCEECGAMLRVSGSDPLELEAVDEDEDDDEDDDDDEDEDDEDFEEGEDDFEEEDEDEW